MLESRTLPGLLSVVIPLFNEEESLAHLEQAISTHIPDWNCPVELILVDDGSTDQTAQRAQEWAYRDKAVKLIVLSRNFGHQIAVTAGIDVAAGEAIVIMDADLQDPPGVVQEMLKGYCEGYDVVYGQRLIREGESAFKLLTAKVFYQVMKKFVIKDIPENTGDFRLISRRVAADLKRMPERQRFLRGMVTWIGYEQKAVRYNRPRRVAGETKYPLLKMIKLAVTGITSFSDAPLRMIYWMGMASMLLAGVLIARTLFLHFFTNVSLVLGWASLSIMLCFFSGLILMAIGILGLYIGNIFIETQGRPLYIVKSSVNLVEGNHENRR